MRTLVFKNWIIPHFSLLPHFCSSRSFFVRCRCYLSTLNFFNQYTAPIFITGVSSLRDMQPPKELGFEGDKKAAEEDDQRITGIWASTATAKEGKTDASKSEGILDDMLSTDLQTKKKRARSRWHLAYTLVRNPVLTRVRGHYLDSLADNTEDDLRTSTDGLEVAEAEVRASVRYSDD